MKANKPSLSLTHPSIAAQWHPTKNGSISPEKILAGSSKKYWWKCPEGPDHEWQAHPNNRTSKGSGCPFCAGKRVSITNSLAVLFPEVGDQWDYEKNGTITPEDVLPGTHKRFWWKCPKGPDHEWEASVNARTQGNSCPFCRGRKVSVTNSLATLHPELAVQWHPTRNGEVTPDQVVAGSHQKIWWLCSEGPDHEWEASVGSRFTSNQGCPYCAGKKASVTNSLASQYPGLAQEWHPTKNGSETPAQVVAGSHQKKWWLCSAGPDHEWEARVRDRAMKSSGCPYCAGKKASVTNSLASQYPGLAQEWHPTKNDEVTPDEVVAGSNKKVWWECPVAHDHEWEATVGSRVAGSGCPYCAGKKASVTNSLASQYPGLAQEWHPTKNGSETPAQVVAGSHQKKWWLCSAGPDHEWEATVGSRTSGRGCPFCASRKVSVTNSLASLYPEIAEEWHPLKNSGVSPTQVAPGSNNKYWWKCPLGPDHEWQAQPNSRINGTGCPYCSGYRVSVTNSLQLNYPEIAQEWHPRKNAPVTPADVVSGSHNSYWWKCASGPDHEWSATLNSRTQQGNSCPFCAGQRPSVTNSLAARFPSIAAQWHPTRNGDVSPEDVVAGSHKKYWWQCPEDPAHEWLAVVKSRTALGRKCPHCYSGWTVANVRLFVKSLRHHIAELSPAELYLIFQQQGILDSYGKARNFANALTTGRIPTEEIEKFINEEPSVADQFLEDASTTIEAALESLVSDDDEAEVDELVDEFAVEEVELPVIQTKEALAALDAAVVTTSDEEAVAYLIASARYKLWRHALLDEVGAIEQAHAFRGSDYADSVRNAFLDEYQLATALPIPVGYTFTVKGQPAPPNLMQRLAAVAVRDQKRVGNWSGTGAGKTLSALLASRVIDARLTVICCPNSVVATWESAIQAIFPTTDVQTKTFRPVWQDDETAIGRTLPRYLVLNYEAFQQRESADRIKAFLAEHRVDFVVVDEIHYAKQRQENLMSRRKELVNALIASASADNPELRVLGMSATPVINNLQEGKSLLEMISGIAYDDLGTRASVANCMSLHQKLVTMGIRWLPQYDIQFEQEIIEVDCTDYLPEIRSQGSQTHNILGLEQVLTEAKLPAIRRILRDNPRPTLIYTHYITGIDRILRQGLVADGWRVGFFTGDDKSGLEAFLQGKLDVLISTASIGTGVDGLQHVCDQLIVNVLPWTSAEFEQLKGRIYRQGQRSEKVKVFIPVTEAHVNGETWSWCRSKLGRIRFKKSIADAAVDGVVPEGHLRTPEQAYRDLMGWLERLDSGGEKVIVRPKITVPLPESNPADVGRRARRYGDFSRMNSRWNQSSSGTTHQRLKENPEEWEQYHTLYRQARESWPVVPYEELIDWCRKRPHFVIGDFGCGEAKIAEALGEQQTVYSFDHVAINEAVTACDMAKVPLEDETLDVAIFSLSLMGENFTDYLREAHRTLRLDGQLHIVEAASRFRDVEAFVEGLKKSGFIVVEVSDMWKFKHIRAMKGENRPDDGLVLEF